MPWQGSAAGKGGAAGWGGKGGGWGGGDGGKGGKDGAAAGKGADRTRVKLLPARVTGRIAEWKEKFGWITPDKPVNHPDAWKKGGRVFLLGSDLERTAGQAAALSVGAAVSFLLYSDGSGIGAMNCRPLAAPEAQRTILKPGPVSSGARRAGEAPRRRLHQTPVAGQVSVWRGDSGFIVPVQPVEHELFTGKIHVHWKDVKTRAALPVGARVTFIVYADSEGLGAEECEPLPSWKVDHAEWPFPAHVEPPAKPVPPPAPRRPGDPPPSFAATARAAEAAAAAERARRPGAGSTDADLATARAAFYEAGPVHKGAPASQDSLTRSLATWLGGGCD